MAALPPNFTLLQVIPELETGGAEQTTLDVARAVVRAGGRAIVASRGGRMAGELAARGGELAALPVHSKNPIVMLANRSRLARLIRQERVSLVHVRSRAPAFAATGSHGRGEQPGGDDARPDGVLPVMADVGDAVGPTHDLALGGAGGGA